MLAGCATSGRNPADPLEPLNRVVFSFNDTADKAVIKPDSFALLDEVVGVLQKNPQLKLVRVEGHTDNRGTATYNLDLSRRRAAAVLEYLVQHGVSRKRLVSAGYGFERPIADNATALGRAKNRRVEFRVLGDDATTKPAK